MANTDPEQLKAAQKAYAASNSSLADYDPRVLSDEEKVKEVVIEAPSEPILTRAEDADLANSLLAPNDAVTEGNTPSKSSSK